MKYIIAGFITLMIVVSPLIAYTTDEVITITVKDKERIVTGSGNTLSSKYLVFTETEVFENTDTIWYWKWDSSDLYNKLDVGKTYEVRVNHFRVPFLSWYRNIIEIK